MHILYWTWKNIVTAGIDFQLKLYVIRSVLTHLLSLQCWKRVHRESNDCDVSSTLIISWAISHGWWISPLSVPLLFSSSLILLKVRRREPNQVRRREPGARPRTAEDVEVRRRSLPPAPTQSRGTAGQVSANRRPNTPPHTPSPRKQVTPRGQLAAPRYETVFLTCYQLTGLAKLWTCFLCM